MADQYTPTPIKTKTAGDVVVKLVDTAGTNVAAVSATNALKVDGSAVTQPVSAAALPLPTGAATEVTLAKLPVAQGSTTSAQSGALMQGAVTTAAPTYTTAQTSPLSLDTAGNLRIAGSLTPSGTQNENLIQVNSAAVNVGTGAASTGTQRVAVASDSTIGLVAGAAVIGALTANQSVNLSQVNGVTTATGTGVSGTGVIRVAPATDVIQQISATTAANAVTNPVWNRLTDGTSALGTGSNPLTVTFEGNAGGTLVDTGQLTSVALAAGATVTVTAAAVTTGTAKFLACHATSSVRIKVELQKFVTAVATTVRTFFVDSNQAFDYSTPDRDAITFAGASGNLFQLKITNMDNVLAADVYGSITQENV